MKTFETNCFDRGDDWFPLSRLNDSGEGNLWYTCNRVQRNKQG